MNPKYKKILIWVILAIIIIGIGSWLYYRFTTEKSLRLTSLQGGETLRANDTFSITWRARNISKVGIVLVKGQERGDAIWIAQDVSGRKGSYDWPIFVWQEPRQDYKIAVFEYPWREGNLIEYSEDFFTILGPEFASCDNASIGAEWPFIPSDYPGLRKVFLTSGVFTGNMGGLEGADKICQEEAQVKGFGGTWKAFLGDEDSFAAARLTLENSIFVEAKSSGDIPEGKTCHRLLGKDYKEFIQKLADPLSINEEKFEKEFLKDLGKVWLGKIDKESKKECTDIYFDFRPFDLARTYSFTTTCQNWSTDREVVSGYSPEAAQRVELPVCFTPLGQRLGAAGLAGLSSGIVEAAGESVFTTSLGRTCSTPQKLLCVQQ